MCDTPAGVGQRVVGAREVGQHGRDWLLLDSVYVDLPTAQYWFCSPAAPPAVYNATRAGASNEAWADDERCICVYIHTGGHTQGRHGGSPLVSLDPLPEPEPEPVPAEGDEEEGA